MHRHQLLLLSLCALSLPTLRSVDGFVPPFSPGISSSARQQRDGNVQQQRPPRLVLLMAESEGDEDETNEPDPFKYYNAADPDATAGDKNNSMLNATTATVIKKKNKKQRKQYKPTDNRDALPFVVQLNTPDPYTRPEILKERARQNTQQERRKKKSSFVTSRVFTNNSNNDDNDMYPLLGEFQLDKSTTCGDVIVVADQQYQVLKTKCQYKYTGGQQFTMVRKILEVKPLQRVAQEGILIKSLQATDASSTTQEPPLLE